MQVKFKGHFVDEAIKVSTILKNNYSEIHSIFQNELGGMLQFKS